VKPLHRLDVDTSGVLLCTADPVERSRVQVLFAEGGVQKTYVALVHGRTHAKGIIRRGLRDARRKSTLEAVTRYTMLESLGFCTLVRVRPETGRKHQVRRHLQGLGHAVVGDRRYRPKRGRKVLGDPGRLWLHAARLVMPDGTVFEAPLPPELEAHLAVLRQDMLARKAEASVSGDT
jgi:23S rRNA-/tRNA-specific pseudouridylate synthase